MKIMFVMLKSLGDVVLGTTICKELKKEYLDSEIVFYTNSPYGDLLRNNPYIDNVRESPEWNLDFIFMDMVVKKFDKVFLPYQVRRECNMWHQAEMTRHQHLVDFYWRRMGMHRPIKERECYLFPTEENERVAESFISFDVPRVAIHSTSSVKTKDWPYFTELVEELRLAGYGVVQIGGRNDTIIPGAIDLRGKMKFMEVAAFLRKCAAFVGLDSGISYISDAMKTSTLVIQGSTNPVTSGPISDRVIHLYAKETGYQDCEVIRCHVNCRHEVNCNTRIKVSDVMEKLYPILESWKSTIVPVKT